MARKLACRGHGNVPECLVTNVICTTTIATFTAAQCAISGDMNAFSHVDGNVGLPVLSCQNTEAVYH